MTNEDIIAARENDWPKWLIALIAFAIMGASSLFFWWVKQQDPTGRVIGNIATLGGSGPITEIAHVVDEPAKGNLRGKEVMFDGIRVIEVFGDYSFLAGTSRDESLPIVLRGELTGRQAEAKTKIEVGDEIRLFGVIRLLDHPMRIDEPSMLDARERKILEQSKIYVSAERVEVTGGA